MIRAALLLLVLLLIPGEVMAKGNAWHRKTVAVNDYTSPAYQPYVAEMVAAFNAMLPKRAPKLIYRAHSERPCAQLARANEEGAIMVCLSGGEWDYTTAHAKDGEIAWAKVVLIGDDPPEGRHATICHELMHAVTDVDDNYLDPHLETSCVQGATTFPGSWDKAYARKIYKKARHR